MERRSTVCGGGIFHNAEEKPKTSQRAREAPVQAHGRDQTEVRARKLVPRARPDAPVRAVAEAHANGLSVALALGPRQTGIAQIEVVQLVAPGASVVDTKSAAHVEEDE